MKNNYSRLKWVALIILGGILFFLSQSVIAATAKTSMFQEQEISGIVSDQNGIPIPGVTIRVKNTNRGVVTNLDGEYEITAPTNGTLVFSYIGFKKQEVTVDGREEISVQLEEDISALGEVKINAGYYSTTERELTGNISRVSGEEIEMQPLVNPLQALQGRMTGVEIIPNTGLPGAAPTIRIRGTNSLRNDGNQPLYVVDGVPLNSTPITGKSLVGQYGTGSDPLNTIGLSNIESIEILKDADATAIYGSRGANGVILITTKKGYKEEEQLEARIYAGVSTVPNRMEMLNTEEYFQLRNAAFENDGVTPTISNAYDLLVWDQNRYTDWQEYFLGGTAPITDINLQYSGGSEQTSFRFGGSYHDQGTIYPADYSYQKITGNFNLNHSSTDEKLNLNLSVNYGIDQNELVGGNSLLSFPFTIPPNAPGVLNEYGSLNWEDWNAVGQNNPLSGYFNESVTNVNNLISNLSLSYKLGKGFTVKTNTGFTNLSSDEIVKLPSYSYNPSYNINDESDHTDVDRNSWIVEPQLIYDSSLGKGAINIILGGTFQKNMETIKQFSGVGYVSDALIGNLDAAQAVNSDAYINSEYKYNAVFGRIGYNWKKKYYLNLTGRRDGSSRFGPGNQFANFGAVGAAWIFSEEEFIRKALPFLSFGKLRGSYGTTGNDQIGNYGYLDSYEVTRGPSGLYPTQLLNPNYSWETNKKLEFATELGFFKDRINFSASWYRNRSSNQLVGLALPAMTGFTSVQANLPATVENTGWELALNTRNIQEEKFNWETSLNISFPRNELVNFPNLESSTYQNTYQIGKPLNIRWLYRYGGLNPDTGIYTIVDINEDGRYDYNDRVETKALVREYFGGLSNNLSYKNLSLQFLWQFVKQKGTLFKMDAGRIGNQRREALEALDENSQYQIPTQSIQGLIGYSYALNSPLFYTDASFIRLKTLSLNYTLPSNWKDIIGVEQASIFLRGQNLFTITPYEGLDPEMPQSGTSFSALRTITGGIQLNF